MTTEERFTVDSDGKWWDKIKHEYVTLDSLFRTVEELDYTINELVKTIRIYDDGYINLNKKYKKLADENKQLKQKVDFYKYFQKDARELEKENEQLKKEVEDLKQIYQKKEITYDSVDEAIYKW